MPIRTTSGRWPPSANRTRLSARPHPATPTLRRGIHKLGLQRGRDGLLYVPATALDHPTAPLVVTLHGAGGDAEGGLHFLTAAAETAGVILLSPESRGRTWDVILEGFGPDVVFINQALAHVFNQHPIDPTRVALGGFSDGASYALSLGIPNGDLFKDLIAFSPGFMHVESQEGKPRIFVSHGVHDTVLPIERCSRTLVPRLRKAGYEVHYEEFDGPHTVPRSISAAAIQWFLTGSENK
jgi:predicted esterase